MDSVVKILLSVFWLGLIPLCAGLSLNARKEEKENLEKSVLFGYFIMFALFEVMCVPATFLKVSFSHLCVVYEGTVLIWAVVSLIVKRKSMWNCLKNIQNDLCRIPFLGYVAFALIVVQIGVYIIGMATDADDAMYVATATTSLHTDGIFTHSCYSGTPTSVLLKRYVLSPFPIFLAFLSRVTGFHPTVMAHTILPVFLVSVCYFVYSLWGRKLFGGDRKSESLFLIFVSFVHMFSYYTVYTQGTFLLIRIWQGKAVLAAILLPALFYYGWLYFEEEKAGVLEWIQLCFLMTSCCLVSSMGIMLAPIMLGILALVCGLPRWRWKRIAAACFSCLPSMILALVYLVLP